MQPFSPNPVVVDTGAVGAGNSRYFSLALSEKTGSRQLLGIPWDSSGKQLNSQTWLDSAFGIGKTVLSGVTAVCGLDAVFSSGSGSVQVVVLVERGGKDEVHLVTRSKTGTTTSVLVVASKKSFGTCRRGYSGVRLVNTPGTSTIMVADTPTNASAESTIELYSASQTPKYLGDVGQAELFPTDSGSATGPGNALAWRGMSAAARTDSATMFAVEHLLSKQRTIAIYSRVF